MKTEMHHWGFTGTQLGMSEAQRRALHQLLGSGPTLLTFHHGDCVGADAQAAELAHLAGVDVVVHPPTDSKKRAWTYVTGDQVWAARPYLVRNHEIVDAVELLIACPKSNVEELRSGTWATVRYARKVHVPVIIFGPDGRRLA